MLDIKLFRENPELIFDSEKKDLEEQKLLKKLLNMILYGEKGEKRLNFYVLKKTDYLNHLKS